MAPAEALRCDGETGRGHLESACAHTIHIHTHTYRGACIGVTFAPPCSHASSSSVSRSGDCFFPPFSFLFCDPVRALKGMGGTDEGGQRQQIREGEPGWVGGGDEGCRPPLRWALTSLRAGRPAALRGSARVWEMASHISVPRIALDRGPGGQERPGRKEGVRMRHTCWESGRFNCKAQYFSRKNPLAAAAA